MVSKLVSLAISAFFIYLIVILLKRSDAAWGIRERRYARQVAKGPQHVEHKWQKVLERMDKGDEANLKLAIIEADSILAEILKFIIPAGASVGERLEKMDKNRLSSLDTVWEAHRLRNFIVHNPKVLITHQQAEEAIKGFERGLRELEYL